MCFGLSIAGVLFVYVVLIRIMIWRKDKQSEASSDFCGMKTDYHNKSIYKAFEFYIKIALAVLTGLGAITAFLLKFKKDGGHFTGEEVENLINAISYLLLIITISFSMIILSHKWSTILRWENSPKFWAFFIWSDFWMIMASNTISFYLLFDLAPDIIEMLKGG